MNLYYFYCWGKGYKLQDTNYEQKSYLDLGRPNINFVIAPNLFKDSLTKKLSSEPEASNFLKYVIHAHISKTKNVKIKFPLHSCSTFAQFPFLP